MDIYIFLRFKRICVLLLQTAAVDILVHVYFKHLQIFFLKYMPRYEIDES